MTPLRRIRAVAPVLLAGALALTMVAAPAQAATASAPKSCFFLDCLFPTPTPTPSPTQSPTPAPSLPFTWPTTAPTVPGTGGGSGSGGSGSGSGGTTVPATPADSGSCDTSAFPAKTSTSTKSRLDYASALQACSKAVAAGDASTKTAAAAADDTPEISNDLTEIKASKLSMTGLAYNGIVTLQSPNGPVKVLSFSADEVDLENMDQTYPFTGGRVEINAGAQTAVLKGNVKLYVTSMASNIFGLIPLTFTPSFPPPLVFSSMFFTNAVTETALVQCDQILLPTLKLPVTAQ